MKRQSSDSVSVATPPGERPARAPRQPAPPKRRRRGARLTHEPAVTARRTTADEARTPLGLTPGYAMRPVAWRWDLARRHAARAAEARAAEAERLWADDWVRRAARRLRAATALQHNGSADPAPDDPPISDDCHLRFGIDLRRRLELEVRLLAGQTDQEIAARCGLPAETVAAYAALFYDVRDRLETDCLRFELFGARLYEGTALGRGDLLKFYALRGGPHVVDGLLAAGCLEPAGAGPEQGANPIAELFDLALAVRTMPITARNFQRLIRLCQRFQQLERAATASRSAVAAPILPQRGLVESLEAPEPTGPAETLPAGQVALDSQDRCDAALDLPGTDLTPETCSPGFDGPREAPPAPEDFVPLVDPRARAAG